jgi:hypothetical protein
MKTLSNFVRGLFRAAPKKPDPRTVPEEKAASQPAQNAKSCEHNTGANDDGPPGYKVRWHH